MTYLRCASQKGKARQNETQKDVLTDEPKFARYGEICEESNECTMLTQLGQKRALHAPRTERLS